MNTTRGEKIVQKTDGSTARIIIEKPEWSVFHIQVLEDENTLIPEFTIISKELHKHKIKIDEKYTKKYGWVIAQMLIKKTLNEIPTILETINYSVLSSIISKETDIPIRERIKLIIQVFEKASNDIDIFKTLEYKGYHEVSVFLREVNEDEMEKVCEAAKGIEHTRNKKVSTLEYYIIEGLAFAAKKINKCDCIIEMIDYKINRTQNQTRIERLIQLKEWVASTGRK
ncbi:MAG: hypothetical protein KatS3mg087_1512 [Patescibacteria group bacterium]|nr:MAG: hypothetical protein KatS3mg087_1512 [Patescibacteria group bacterium]